MQPFPSDANLVYSKSDDASTIKGRGGGKKKTKIYVSIL